MFAHLHCHFLGSYSDSLLDPKKVLPLIKKLGQEAIAITDHGVLAYWLPFYHHCRELGLHPVLGCEVYFVENAAASIERREPYRNHLVLLAKNNLGFLNLIRLNNSSWLENSYGEVRGLVDWGLLERFHQGLVALSGCFWGSLPQKYITQGLKEAERELGRYREIFGEDFHPELGRHGIVDEEKANAGLLELSRRHHLKPVVTNDCHYLIASDWEAHDVLIKTRFGYPTNFQVDARNYYLKSEKEMRQLGFPAECYDWTAGVAHECRVDLETIEPPADPGTFREEEAVFSSRPVIIDGRQALRDTAAVLDIDRKELAEILSLVPAGSELKRLYQGGGVFRDWMEKRKKLWKLAAKLEGLPRSSEPDFEKVLTIPLRQARSWLPLQKSRGEVMVQYPPAALEELGVEVRPVAAFRESHRDFCRRVQDQSILNEAEFRFRGENYAAAAVLLQNLLHRRPDWLMAHYLLGHSLFFLGRYQEALKEYSYLEEKKFYRRRMPLVFVRQGWAYCRLGEGLKARESFAKSLKVEPDYPPAHYALGVLEYREGRSGKARRLLRRYLEIKPRGRGAEKARLLLEKMARRKNGATRPPGGRPGR